LFVDKRTPSEVESILKYDFIDQQLNLKTIQHYFSIFNRIRMDLYLEELDCIMLENEVEIDESHLFKTKPSFAAHRSLAFT